MGNEARVGVNGFRDTTNAQLARLDMPATRARTAMALEMLKAGKLGTEIQEATRAKFGIAAGGGMLTRLRARLEKEAKREARRAKRETKPSLSVVKMPPAEPETQWVRLPATLETVTALVTAKAPFIFDGKTVSLKGGDK